MLASLARGSRRFGFFGAGLATVLAAASPGIDACRAAEKVAKKAESRFVDLSLLVAPELPCTWPAGWPSFQLAPYKRIGPLSAYNSDILTIDPNTGTQLDAPPHSIPRPELKLANAGPAGNLFTEKLPAWQFVGEACIVDVRSLRDKGPKGESPLVLPEHVKAWEKSHRPLGPGDVVLFRSDYSDDFYRPLPEGDKFIADPVNGKQVGWPDPGPECMTYLSTRKVMTLGTDSPSMGPIPLLAEPTHIAGLKHGMIWTEGATALGSLPETGAFYCMLGPKYVRSAASEARVFAIVGQPLASRLIESARKKQVVDLSVELNDDLPVWNTGAGAGTHRHPYFTVLFNYNKLVDLYQQTHMLDSHTGTHLVPPAYALPPAGFDNARYAPEVQGWLAEYEQEFGPRGTSEVTTDEVPLDQTCGHARVIDVRSLVGSTSQANWPASPEITAAHVEAYEKEHGLLQAGEVALFRTGHNDEHFKKLPAGTACVADPLLGKSEGWPAPNAAAIALLAERGVRCVGIDAPSLGGVDPRAALRTYWMLGTKGMVGVEYLTKLSETKDGAYFIFAAIKIRGCHGGPGRAIALY